MITKIFEHTKKEKFKIVVDNKNIIWKFIDTYLKDNNTRHLFKISEYIHEDDNLIKIKLSFNDFVILTINFIDECISLVSLKDAEYPLSFDTEDTIKYLKDYLDHFYTYVYEYYIYGEYNIAVKINNIPIVNVDKYMDFLEVILLTYKKNDIKGFKKYKDLLIDYKNEFETDVVLKNYKKEFYNKFDHWYNAKNFDLL